MSLRVAMIGCGPVAETHIETISESNRSEVVVVVDPDLEAARAVATRHRISEVRADWKDVHRVAQVAVVANALEQHSRTAIELVRAGLHVLVEPPMALSTRECDRLIAASDSSDVRLAVGFVSRFLGVAPYVHRMVDRGLIGRVLRFDIKEGARFASPLPRDLAAEEDQRGGVLVKKGTHVFDLVTHWLGEHEKLAYESDGLGGGEENCKLTLSMKNGAQGTVELSTTRNLRDTWILEGANGTLEVSRRFDADFRWRIYERPVWLEAGFHQRGWPEDPLEAYRLQWNEFLEAVENHRMPKVGGVEGHHATKLIESCRAIRPEG